MATAPRLLRVSARIRIDVRKSESGVVPIFATTVLLQIPGPSSASPPPYQRSSVGMPCLPPRDCPDRMPAPVSSGMPKPQSCATRGGNGAVGMSANKRLATGWPYPGSDSRDPNGCSNGSSIASESSAQPARLRALDSQFGSRLLDKFRNSHQTRLEIQISPRRANSSPRQQPEHAAVTTNG